MNRTVSREFTIGDDLDCEVRATFYVSLAGAELDSDIEACINGEWVEIADARGHIEDALAELAIEAAEGLDPDEYYDRDCA